MYFVHFIMKISRQMTSNNTDTGAFLSAPVLFTPLPDMFGYFVCRFHICLVVFDYVSNYRFCIIYIVCVAGSLAIYINNHLICAGGTIVVYIK